MWTWGRCCESSQCNVSISLGSFWQIECKLTIPINPNELSCNKSRENYFIGSRANISCLNCSPISMLELRNLYNLLSCWCSNLINCFIIIRHHNTYSRNSIHYTSTNSEDFLSKIKCYELLVFEYILHAPVYWWIDRKYWTFYYCTCAIYNILTSHVCHSFAFNATTIQYRESEESVSERNSVMFWCLNAKEWERNLLFWERVECNLELQS